LVFLQPKLDEKRFVFIAMAPQYCVHPKTS
jgi:hypothetical protein